MVLGVISQFEASALLKTGLPQNAPFKAPTELQIWVSDISQRHYYDSTSILVIFPKNIS